MPSLGGFEIVIIVALIILLFGVGRIGKIGGEMNNSVKFSCFEDFF